MQIKIILRKLMRGSDIMNNLKKNPMKDLRTPRSNLKLNKNAFYS